MAEVLVQNLRNPEQLINIMVTLRRVSIVTDRTGDQKWVLEASTDERDSEGDLIPPEIMYLSNYDTLTEDVNDLINNLCKKIDWDYEPDYDPPEIIGHWPISGDIDVSVDTEIIVNLAEIAPSAGIDMDSIKIKVKGFDVTDQASIKGDLHSCSVTITPGTKYKSAIDPDFDWSLIEEGDFDG